MAARDVLDVLKDQLEKNAMGPQALPGRPGWVRGLADLLLGLLTVCAGAALYFSLRWPLVGDSSLMHYVVFLMSKGLRPYGDIVDVNLPGSYAAEAVAMKLFGWGALGWRVYDGLLMMAFCAAAVMLAGRRWRAGVFAGGVFALVHLQDGLAQAGQRDLLLAVLVVAAFAMLAEAQERPRGGAAIAAFGVLLGATGTIKPVFLPLGLVLLVLSIAAAGRRGVGAVRHCLCGMVGMVMPVAVMLLWLRARGSLAAFVRTATGLVRYHAALGHRPVGYLLTHAVAPLLPLVVVWVGLLAWRRKRPSLLELELMLGAGTALAAYVVQGKGYPYQRYPLLGLVLVLVSRELFAALEDVGLVRVTAGAAVALMCVVFAPMAAVRVRSYSGDRPFEQALTADLVRLNPRGEGLGLGGVQCLDTFGGCINTLYDMRVVQATGYLYDCYLFTPGNDAVAETYREGFWTAYERAKPRVIVMTNQYCFGGNSFRKLDEWPRFREELARTYVQMVSWHGEHSQHWWSRREMPADYRIYVRRDELTEGLK